MFSPLVVALLFLAPPSEPTAAAVVVATQNDSDLQKRIAHIDDWNQALGVTVLDQSDVLRRLTGQPFPKMLDLDAMTLRFNEAEDLQYRGDRAGAIAARKKMMAIYDNTVVPNYDLQLIIARTLHDEVGAAVEIRKTARDAALEAQRRFPDVAMDAVRHPPEVADALGRAGTALQLVARTDVTIVSTKPGRVMADRMDLGLIEKTKTVKVPLGTWNFWIYDAQGSSLSHLVIVSWKPMVVDIDFALEAQLSLAPALTLKCDGSSCHEALRALAKRLGVTQAVGLRLDDRDPRRPAISTLVRTDDDNVESRPVIALADLNLPPDYFLKEEAARASRFSAWSLVPFGGGQYAEGRYVVGSIFAAAGVGLLTWNVIAAVSRGNVDIGDSGRGHSLSRQQNISAGLLVGVALVGIGEAIYYGIKHPTYPHDTTTPTTEIALKPLPEATTSVDAARCPNGGNCPPRSISRLP